MFRKLCLLITPIECNPSQLAMDVSINSPLKYYAANETANEKRSNKKPISKAVLHSCPRLRFNTLRVYAAKPQWQRRIHTHIHASYTHKCKHVHARTSTFNTQRASDTLAGGGPVAVWNQSTDESSHQSAAANQKRQGGDGLLSLLGVYCRN